MNYTNEDNNDQLQNNNIQSLRSLNYNSNIGKISKIKQKFKTENNNQEVIEFKPQKDFIFMKNSLHGQNMEPYQVKTLSKNQKQLCDSSNNIMNNNKKKNEYQIMQPNKSNSSVKINTKIKSKKYYTTKNSNKSYNSYTNDNFSNDINNYEIINTNNNIFFKNFHTTYQGQNSVKVKGNKMINHYSNNKNNHLTMTKSSIQITGNYPLNYSQNIKYNQSKIESMEFNIEGNNNSRSKFRRKNNIENFNVNKARSIQNKYINNQNYKNKTHLVKRETNYKIMNYDSNDNFNLTPVLVPDETIYYSNNIKENSDIKKVKIYNKYNTNNSGVNNNRVKSSLIKPVNMDLDKNIQFEKNRSEYNNIFFYNSNNNTNDIIENFSINEDKNIFHSRNNDNIMNNNNLEFKGYNNKVNYNNKYNNNKNQVSTSNIKESKIKNKFVYKKSGNLSEKKQIKPSNNKNQNNSLIKDDGVSKNTEQTKNGKSKINEKKSRKSKNGDKIIKSINKYDIINNKDIDIIYYNINNDKNNNFEKSDKKNIKKKEYNKNIIIRKTEIKNKLKNSYDLVDFKLKIPDKNNIDKEQTYTINIKKHNISEKVENIINENLLDNDYYEPLLSLVNNSIDILNNVKDMNISKDIKIESKNNNSKLFKEGYEDISSNETSEINNLDYSIIVDLIEKNKYKEYIGDIYSDIDEINENSKILNMSI